MLDLEGGVRLIQREIEGREVRRHLILVDDDRIRLPLDRNFFYNMMEASVQCGQCFCRLAVRGEVGIDTGAVTELGGRQWTETRDVMEERLEDRLRLLREQRTESGFIECQRILLYTRIRDEVRTIRQHLPHGGLGSGDALHGIDDAVVIAEQDDVRVLAHQLDREVALSEVAHLIEMLDGEEDDTLETVLVQRLVRLSHVEDRTVSDVLPEGHTEGRRVDRRRLRILREGAERKGRIDRDLYLHIILLISHGQLDLILLRLCDLRNPAADQTLAKLLYGRRNDQSIICHSTSPFYIKNLT